MDCIQPAGCRVGKRKEEVLGGRKKGGKESCHRENESKVPVSSFRLVSTKEGRGEGVQKGEEAEESLSKQRNNKIHRRKSRSQRACHQKGKRLAEKEKRKLLLPIFYCGKKGGRRVAKKKKEGGKKKGNWSGQLIGSILYYT